MDDADEVRTLLREIRDAALAHQRYIEERDRKHNEYLAAEAERVERQQRLQARGWVLWVLIVVALYLIAAAQLLR
ncbi:MAG: hypothetical protein MUF18_18525 [Fimbriiglobus sp.]|nr:hypothetical protein [Fimbriiglobus sp.]